MQLIKTRRFPVPPKQRHEDKRKKEKHKGKLPHKEGLSLQFITSVGSFVTHDWHELKGVPSLSHLQAYRITGLAKGWGYPHTK